MIEPQQEQQQQHLLLLQANHGFAQSLFWLSSTLLGIFFCKIVYDIMRALSPLYSKGYRQLSKSEQIEWNNRGFSTAHALLVAGAAANLLIFSDFFDDSASFVPVVFRSSIFSQLIIGVSIGYFLSDLSMILWFYPALGGAEYVLHHLISAGSLIVSLYSGHAQIYVFMSLFSEITTPFVNLRWYLLTTGLKSSRAYVINGVLLFLGWLVARVLLFLYLFLHVYQHYDQVKEMTTGAYLITMLAPPCFTAMNVFWFYKIVRGLLRTLSKMA